VFLSYRENGTAALKIAISYGKILLCFLLPPSLSSKRMCLRRLFGAPVPDTIEYAGLTSGFDKREQMETQPSVAFGMFSSSFDEDGDKVISFRTVQHRSGPSLPANVRVIEPGEEHVNLIDRLPEDEYAVEAAFLLTRENTVGLLWIDARDVFRPKEQEIFDARALLHRLEDRHLVDGFHYSAESFDLGIIAPDEPATCLDPYVEPVSAGQVRGLIEEIQQAHAEGRVPNEMAMCFDKAPGFSWVEPEQLEGRLYAAVRGIVQRYGENILTDAEARVGETGLANTLKLTDIVTHDPKLFPKARGELAQLKQGGWIFMIRAASRDASHLYLPPEDTAP
jgi:hypothetical protein